MKILNELEEIITCRKVAKNDESYTFRLLKNKTLASRKVSEEAYEVCEAALLNDRKSLVEESADLLYHLIVLLAQKEIRFDEVLKVLKERREQS